jgi:tRNA pseudouridine55 synthase
MDKILNIYKPVGITPFQLIKELRKKDSSYRNLTIGYAGRLDPLAHGVMLLMIGDENKNREKYLGLNKTYEFSVLFGIKTDSYDYLGLLDDFEISASPPNLREKIESFINSHQGVINLPYPPFSSKTVKGVPLYKLAKMGKASEDLLPKKEVELHSFKLLSIENISSIHLKDVIFKNLGKIKGYFRQKKTIALWENFFNRYPTHQFKMASFSIECSSGTYVRSIANKMGAEFGCNAIAFEIYRTKVGKYEIQDAIRIK